MKVCKSYEVFQVCTIQYTIVLVWNLAFSISISTALLFCFCGNNVKHGLLLTFVSKKTTIWQLKKSHSNDKLLEKITSFSYHMEQKTFIEASGIYNIHSGEKIFLQLLLLKLCESFRLLYIAKFGVYFGLCVLLRLEKRRPNKYCLCEANLIFHMQVFSLMGQDLNLARKTAV